jgi:hypothetical protein
MTAAPAYELAKPFRAAPVIGFAMPSPPLLEWAGTGGGGALSSAPLLGHLTSTAATVLGRQSLQFVPQRCWPAEKIQARAPRLGKQRSREWAWRKDNEERLQREFLELWVVLEGEDIIATGRDPIEVVQLARQKGIRSPYVFRVDRRVGPKTSLLGL